MNTTDRKSWAVHLMTSVSRWFLFMISRHSFSNGITILRMPGTSLGRIIVAFIEFIPSGGGLHGEEMSGYLQFKISTSISGVTRET